MKILAVALMLAVAAWAITSLLMMAAFASAQFLGDPIYSVAYTLANWPLMIWHLFDPIEAVDGGAYTTGLLRNFAGWCIAFSALAPVIYKFRKKARNED
jgi:hypothetical protein